MVKAQDASIESAKKDKMALTKIEPVKIDANSSNSPPSDIADVPIDDKIKLEKSLIDATMLLLREYGIRKSGAAIRDAVDISLQYVGPKEAVSAFSRLGFKASFGRLNIKDLSEEFFTYRI